MIWRILKKILAYVEIRVYMHSGDTLRIMITFGNKVVLDTEIDFIPGV